MGGTRGHILDIKVLQRRGKRCMVTWNYFGLNILVSENMK
jgi:hypothetical protein